MFDFIIATDLDGNGWMKFWNVKAVIMKAKYLKTVSMTALNTWWDDRMSRGSISVSVKQLTIVIISYLNIIETYLFAWYM